MESQPPETPKLSHLESTPPPPSVPPITPPKKPKTLILILSLSTLLSLATTAYYFYQNQKIPKEINYTELASYNDNQETNPTNVALATFTHPSQAFSIGYLPNWTIDYPQPHITTFYLINEGEIEPRNHISISIHDYQGEDLKAFVLDGNLGENNAEYFKTNNLEFIFTTEHPVYQTYKSSSWPAIGNSQIRLLISDNQLAFIHADPLEINTDLFAQILSTFQFSDAGNITSPSTPKSPTASKRLPFAMPPEWTTYTDDTNTFSFGYHPQNMRVQKEGALYWITQQRPDPSLGFSSFGYIGIRDYNNGSRRAFILDQTTLTDQDKFFDYHEQEFTIDGMNCLFLNGISISQTPTVQGMCALSPTKALSINLYDRDIEPFIQTIKKL